jgi:hypothetical protein
MLCIIKDTYIILYPFPEIQGCTLAFYLTPARIILGNIPFNDFKVVILKLPLVG